jgi:tetratricopeptide (TPR) repeat protein
MPDAKKSAKKSARKGRTTTEARVQMKELDRALRQAFEMFAGEELTREDVTALAASLTGPSAHEGLSEAEANARDEAQQIAFEAMDAETEAQARRLAKRALKLDPDCVDALLVMTDVDAHTERERLEGLQRAVSAGERSLGERFIRENTGHFWLLIETRPYMRALELLAQAYRVHGMRRDAIALHEKILMLNPNDNQGMREPLLGLYLETGELSAAARLLKQYDEDNSAGFAWGRVLERFLAGDREGASAALKEARRVNHHVELYLMELKPLPRELPEMFSPGGEGEAVMCLNHVGRAWAEHTEAVRWLFGQLENDRSRRAPGKARLKKTPAGETIH